MSGLSDKARDSVRAGSGMRKPAAQNDGSNPDDLLRSARTDLRDSGNSTQPRLSSPTIPAWHIHKGNTRPSSDSTNPMPSVESLNLDSNDTPARTEYNTAASRTEEYNLPAIRDDFTVSTDSEPLTKPSYPLTQIESGDSDKIPVRSLSTYDPVTDTIRSPNPSAERGGPFGAQQKDAVGYPYTVPRRKESLPQNRVLQRRNKEITDRRINPQQNIGVLREEAAPTIDTEARSSLPQQSFGGDLNTEINQALASLSVGEKTTRRVPESRAPEKRAIEPPTAEPVESNAQVPEESEHLRLPADFNLGRTEKTVIDTQWKPAVTHENVHRQKTEIVREAITRDIHIHHYYTYVQPIKVTEILPAKHYRLDPTTGRKIEIPAPAGWTMPPHLQPRTEDISEVRGFTRHYLVNDQYPYGIPEPPPPESFNPGGGRPRVINKYSTRLV